LLVKDNMIKKVKSLGNNKPTIYKIINYETYNSRPSEHIENSGIDDDLSQVETKWRPSGDQVTTTKEEGNKVKKEKKVVSLPHRKIQHLTISVLEYEKLCTEYGQSTVDKKLDYCENYAKLKNFKSLYLTVNNWLKSDGVKDNQPIAIDPQDIGDILRRMK